MQNSILTDSSRGRPQSTLVRKKILQATLTLIGEQGVDRLTFEAIAARAGTSRPAIYRRWKKKEELVVEALELHRPQMTIPDTGSLRGDITQLAADFIGHYSKPLARQSVLAILNTASHDGKLGREWAARYGGPRIEDFRIIFTRAIKRGELPADTDVNTIMFILSSSLLQICLLKDLRPYITDSETTGKVIDFILKKQS